MRFRVTGRGSVKPPDGKRVEPGRTGTSDDQAWLNWAARSGQIKPARSRRRTVEQATAAPGETRDVPVPDTESGEPE